MTGRRLTPGITVRVTCVGSRFSGNYVVSGAVLTFGAAKGMRTMFSGTKGTQPVPCSESRFGRAWLQSLDLELHLPYFRPPPLLVTGMPTASWSCRMPRCGGRWLVMPHWDISSPGA